jgi:tRNA threonylcarbamoyladenosine biosynthesis protein TsaE
MSLRLLSHSSADTQWLGERLGHLLMAGDIVCLYGELGSGKTVLMQGMARGLGVSHERAVRSPSFMLIHCYQGRVPVYHADLYRLEGLADIAEIGLCDLLGGDGVAVIEWADKLDSLLPSERLDVRLSHHTEETRLITINPQGERYRQRLEPWQRQGMGQVRRYGMGEDAVETTTR